MPKREACIEIRILDAATGQVHTARIEKSPDDFSLKSNKEIMDQYLFPAFMQAWSLWEKS